LIALFVGDKKTRPEIIGTGIAVGYWSNKL